MQIFSILAILIFFYLIFEEWWKTKQKMSDLSPLENIWCVMKRRIRQWRPQTVNQKVFYHQKKRYCSSTCLTQALVALSLGLVGLGLKAWWPDCWRSPRVLQRKLQQISPTAARKKLTVLNLSSQQALWILAITLRTSCRRSCFLVSPCL